MRIYFKDPKALEKAATKAKNRKTYYFKKVVDCNCGLAIACCLVSSKTKLIVAEFVYCRTCAKGSD